MSCDTEPTLSAPSLDHYERLFEASPSATFVLQEDLGIVEFNPAAAKLANHSTIAKLDTRPGELLRCIQTVNGVRCGASSQCDKCDLRRVAHSALDSSAGDPCLHRMVLMRADANHEVCFLVKAASLTVGARVFAILCLEEMTEFLKARPVQSGTRLDGPIALP